MPRSSGGERSNTNNSNNSNNSNASGESDSSSESDDSDSSSESGDYGDNNNNNGGKDNNDNNGDNGDDDGKGKKGKKGKKDENDEDDEDDEDDSDDEYLTCTPNRNNTRKPHFEDEKEAELYEIYDARCAVMARDLWDEEYINYDDSVKWAVVSGYPKQKDCPEWKKCVFRYRYEHDHGK